MKHVQRLCLLFVALVSVAGCAPTQQPPQEPTVTKAEGGEVPRSVSRYDNGQWTVIYTRKRKSSSGISFGISSRGTAALMAYSVLP